ncbi:MAG: alpha/beta hydrolase [Solirubrobacteraceae bacterium]|nr:alpha/beta hydrolase [Solirubrobacteraceae bacterium]
MSRLLTGPAARIHAVDRGDGDPVVLVHGWSMSHEPWAATVDDLVAAGHRVIAVDLRGHGRSDAPDDDGGYALDDLAGDVLALLRARDVPPATVVGWSLGGMVSVRLAALAPDRVDRIVLVASNGVAHARSAAFPFGMEPDVTIDAVESAERADRVAGRRAVLAGGFGDRPDPDALERLLRVSLGTDPRAEAGCLRTLLRTHQVDLLPDGLPVTQILGDRDRTVSRRGGDWVVSQIPGAVQVALPCGHYPMIEAPDAFHAALRRAVHHELHPDGRTD